jgi:hypothetical protein
LVNFKIYQSDFTTVLSLCGLENNSEEILSFQISDKNAHAVGDSFNYKLNIGASEILFNDNSVDKVEPNVYKNQLSHMEAETCQVYVHENRFVLFSEQSSTSIAIGLVEK